VDVTHGNGNRYVQRPVVGGESVFRLGFSTSSPLERLFKFFDKVGETFGESVPQIVENAVGFLTNRSLRGSPKFGITRNWSAYMIVEQ
jgi:hypothetical protein